ncbi:MAG: hypothetical protein ACYT04_72190 [Nostoc sp.]
MFTIGNPFANQTAFSSHSNSLRSQNPQVRRASDLLDETLYCMIASHDFFPEQVCQANKSSPGIAAPQMKQ